MADALSPAWWLEKLSGELDGRRSVMREYEDWYSGAHPFPFVTKAHEAKMRNQFRAMLKDSKSNFMRLVVDAVEERLRVEGFRLSASEDEAADRESWRIWQANKMDSESQVAFVEALVKGVSYLSVWPGDKFPSIAVEDPMQTIVGYEPGSNFRRRAAALKVWHDDWTGKERANVYLPGGIWKFERASEQDDGRAASQGGSDGPFKDSTAGGSRRASANSPWAEIEADFVANPFNVVPIIPLRNRPRLLCEGESEISDVVSIQSQVNSTLFLMSLASYFGGHRQRYATGMKLEADPGNPNADAFDIAIDRLIAVNDPAVKFGDFEVTPLDGYIAAIEQKVRHIATTTRTPRHYLEQSGQSPSGDAIKSAESGLVKKVERKQRPFGEGLEEAMGLARLMQGGDQAPVDSEIVWADPQVRSEAETTDAAIKRWQARLTPWTQTMEDLGYSQTAIARMLVEFGGTPPEPDAPVAPPPVRKLTLSDGRTATMQEVMN